jgi:hypothetical protein
LRERGIPIAFAQSYFFVDFSEKIMRILLISSAFNSMTQRFYVELADNGYEVAVELYGGNEDLLKESASLFAPDLIIAPFLRDTRGDLESSRLHHRAPRDRRRSRPVILGLGCSATLGDLGRNVIASRRGNGRWPDLGEQNISFAPSPEEQHLSTRNNRSGSGVPVGSG